MNNQLQLHKFLRELGEKRQKMSYVLASEKLGFNVIPVLQKITDEEIVDPNVNRQRNLDKR
jgi:hypothetical protein